jgi:hypothetical protein
MYLLEMTIDTPTNIKGRAGKSSATKNFPFLNRLMVQTPITRNSCKKHWESKIIAAICSRNKPKKPLTKWYAEYIWYVPFTMDADNVSAGTKHINDALVKAGVISDDKLSMMGTTVVLRDGLMLEEAIIPIHRFIKTSSTEKRVTVRISDKPFYDLVAR